MKTYESETSLFVDREGVLISIADPVSRKAGDFPVDRAPLMERATFRRLFDRHEGLK